MNNIQFWKNNAASTLFSAVTTTSATTIYVQYGDGALFTPPAPGQTCQATLTQSGTESSWEIVTVVSVTSGNSSTGDAVTVIRGQEGTTPQTWAAGSKFEMRITAQALTSYELNAYIAASGVPVAIPSSGTIATNGTVTFSTAFNYAVPGSYMFLPATAFGSGGSSGFYWVQMSSSTVGQVYTAKYFPSNGLPPVAPTGTLTAATGSNSAYTQNTQAAYAGIGMAMIGFSYPAYPVGDNGLILVGMDTEGPASGGQRMFCWAMNGSALWDDYITPSFGQYNVSTRMGITGSSKQQTGALYYSNGGVQVRQPQYNTVSLTTSGVLTIQGALVNATDWFMVNNATVTFLPTNP